MARKSKKTEDKTPDLDKVEDQVTDTTEAMAAAAEDNLDEDLSVVLDEVQDPQDIKDLEALDGAESGAMASDDPAAEAADTDTPDDGATEVSPAEDMADAVEVEDAGEVNTGESSDDMAVAESANPAPEEASAPAQDVAPALTPPPQVIEKRGPGFVPLVLGGVIAAAIGYGVATFLAPPPPPGGGDGAADTARLDALEAQIASLSAPDGVDLSGLEAAQADALARLDALEARLTSLEGAGAATQASGASTANLGEGSAAAAVSPEDLAGVAAQVAALQAAVDGLGGSDGASARIDALEATVADLAERAALSDLEARVAALEASADTMRAAVTTLEAEENDAEALAVEAARNQMRLALDTGQPFADQLAVLGGDIPAPLSAVAEAGLPTEAALTEAFPSAARAALSAARAVEPVEGNPVTAFLRRQTGARSLEPQEGNSADAVLSRAEAAVRGGDIATALTELAALPAEGQAVLADWTAAAQTRQAALEAATAYLSAE